MNEPFFKVKYEKHYPYCACFQNVEWNTKCIAKKDFASGYVVQRFNRIMETNSKVILGKYGSESYYEAWRVIKGAIIEEDKGNSADDFIWIGHQLCPYMQFYDSIGSNGIINFSGEILWIEEKTSLFSIVDKWDRREVKDANGLKATYFCPELDNIAFPMKRHFSHQWDLSNEQDVYSVAKETIFRICPGNEERDYEYCDDLLKKLLRESRPEMSTAIKSEWEKSRMTR